MINKRASGALAAYLLLKKRSTRMMRMRSNMKDECYIMSVDEGGGGSNMPKTSMAIAKKYHKNTSRLFGFMMMLPKRAIRGLEF